MRSLGILSIIALALSIAACGKAEDKPTSPPAAAPPAETPAAEAPTADAPAADAPAAEAPAPEAPAAEKVAADTPEKAFALARTAFKRGDFDTLWALFPTAMRAELEATVKGLGSAPDEALAGMGLTRDEAAKLTPKAFLAKMMARMPDDMKAAMSEMPEGVVYEKVDDTKTWAKFRRGEAFCEAELLKEEDGWKVGVESCEAGG